MRDRTGRILLLLFFLSGATALVYELLWEKKLELVLGTTAEGLTAILSTFFAGLALGSFIFGKLADRLDERRLLFTYGFVEIGIGVLGASSPFVFSSLGPAPLLFLLAPATLIGGTFPLITRYFSNLENLRDRVSLLYALNTLGAILGVLVATFLLIRVLGVNGGIWAAAATNVFLGIIVLGIATVIAGPAARSSRPMSSLDAAGTRRDSIRSRHPLILFIFFLTGFLALALEVLWTKALVLVFGGSFYSFSVILVAFLLGIVLGSFSARFFDKNKAWFWFGAVQGAIAIWVLISLPLFNKLPFLFISLFARSPNFSWNIISAFFVSALVIFPATFLSGLSFPFAVEIYRNMFPKVGEGVGRVYSVNTLGGILGPIAVYFLLLPSLGIQKAIILAGLIYGLIAAFFLIRRFLRPTLVLLISILILFVSNILVFGWEKAELSSGRYLYRQPFLPGTQLLFYKEGKNSTVSVRKTIDGDISLQVNGKTDASAIGDLDTELLLGHIPLLFAKEPKKVLVIGFGSGITAGAVSTHPVEEIEIAEIEEAVLEAAPFFAIANHDILSDKRVKVIGDDARSYLTRSSQKYDVVTSEPSNPWIAGVSNLFTKEFYELVFNRLSDGGVMFQWIHTYNMSPENLKIAIRTFSEVFPEVWLWANYSGDDIFLMGSKMTPDLNITSKFTPKVREDLARIDLTSPLQVFDFYVSSGKTIEKKLGDGRIHSDNFPWLELDAPADLYSLTKAQNLSFLLEVVEKHPRQSEDSLVFRKLALFAQKAWEEESLDAGGLFAQALGLRPKNDRLEDAYAEVLLREAGKAKNKKDYELAENLLKKSIELSSEKFLAFRLLGEVYLAMEDPDSAIPVLKKSIELYPQHSDSHMFLGVAYGMKEDWENSERELRQALRLDPKNELAKKNLDYLRRVRKGL